MTDYGVDLAKVVAILDPQPVELESPAPVAVKTRRPRQVKVYVQPVTGKRIETRSGNHAQLKAWKKDLAAVRKQLKAKNDSFRQHLDAAVDGLTPEAAAELLLAILHDDMRAIVERYIAAQRKAIVAAFESWWDKYRVTLTEIEGRRDTAAKALHGFLKGLGYV